MKIWNLRNYQKSKSLKISKEIKKGQTIQWPKEKGQTDKQRSTNHYTES